MSESKVNIMLIDRQQLFREGVKQVLESESTFHIVVSSDDYSVIKTLIRIEQVDVILIDINILLENKASIYGDVLQSTDTKVIALSNDGEQNFITEAVKLGVHGYLLKEMDIYSFIDAIKTVQNGASYIHPAATYQLVQDYRKLLRSEQSKDSGVRRPLHLYTKRECEVLQLLTNGQSNRDIAKTLAISEKTVKNHVSSLFKKMNVHDRTQAVVMAIRNNWVEL